MMRFFERFEEQAVVLKDAHVARRAHEAEARIRAMCWYFQEKWELRPGDTIALLLSNRVEVFELLLAGIAAGLNVVPMSGALRREELEYIVEDSGASWVIYDGELGGAFGGEGRAVSLEVLEGVFARESSWVNLETPLNKALPGGAMVYTSGTTGKPKAVVRARPATLSAAVEGFRRAGKLFGLDGSGAHLVAGPLYHAAPLLFALYDLLNGARVVILPRFDARNLLETIEAERIAHVHLVPTHFVRLLRLEGAVRESADISSLTLTLHGAAPIASSVKRAMIEWWGGRVREYWGATEGGIYTLIDAEDWLEREGSVGRPLPHFEIAAFDDDGNRLGPNEVGTLYVRHRENARPFVYRGDEAKTREAYLDGGFFTAGDLGHLDQDGYVYLSARRSNLIISGGVNIYPADVEAALIEDDVVEDAFVYGEPDEEWGETVVAAIALRTACDSTLVEQLCVRLEGRLAKYKMPKMIEVYDAIPRNEAGKVRKVDLEEAVVVARFDRR